MRKITKRVFALLLSVMMVLSIVPVCMVTVSAEPDYASILNEIKKEYPTGSYFSANKKKCNHGAAYANFPGTDTLCYNCELQTILKARGYSEAERKNYASGHRTCHAYASYCFTRCFNKPLTDKNYTVVATKSLTSNMSASQKYDFLKKAKIGDILRSDHHSMVFVSCDSKGVTIQDANVDGKTVRNKKGVQIEGGYTGTVRCAKIAYAKFNHTSLKIYHAKNYGDAVPASAASITVTLDGLLDRANTFVKVKSHFNTTVNLQQVTYIYSTDASKIVGKNFAANTSNLGLGTQVEGETFAKCAWLGPENLAGATTTIPNLKPNTTYYYCILIKANGKWWQSTTADATKCGHFTTANDKPETPVLAVSKGSADIGIGGTVNLSWNDCKYNSAYDVSITKDGVEVYKKEDIQGTLLSIPGEDVFTAAGTYNAVLTAKNPAGSAVSDAAVITVHDDVTVTFYGSDGQMIYEKTVRYGESVEPPETPYKEGHEFQSWKYDDREETASFENIMEDAEFVPVYEIKKYKVVFVNGETNEPILVDGNETQEVEYMAAAKAPQANHGFRYTWDTDFSCVKSDLTVKAVSSWYNENYPLSVSKEESTFVRDADGKGYDYSVKITRDPDKTKEAVTGRLVIALKTKDGYMFGKTDSAAFNFGRNFNEESDSITVKGFVACENAVADTIEVFTVGSYEKAGALAEPKTITPDNTNQFTWNYADDENSIPSEAVNSSQVTLYRYRQKIMTTSYATSLDGYIRDGYEKKTKSSGTLDYVKTWQTYNKTGTTLYNQYNKTPVKASETDTTITEVSETQSGYIYWHWCKSGTKTIGSGDAGDQQDGFKTLHQFYKSDAKLSNDSTYTNLAKKTGVCSNSPYWWNKTDREHSPVAVYRQEYTVSNKLYHYYKWSEWSDWSAEIPPAGTDYETKEAWQYTIEAEPIPAPEGNSISGWLKDPLKTLDASFADKKATVFIYKYTEPSDYTNEYVVSTKIDDGGTLNLGEGYLREAPSAETGDFTIVASIEGQSAPIEIGTIAAPPAQLEVKFKYDEPDEAGNERVIRIVNIKQGDSIAPPDESEIAVPEDKYLKGWSQSTANIQDNLVVTPVFMKKPCVVVFIDWGKREFKLNEYQYGDKVTIPDYTDVEGKTVEWDLSKINNEDLSENGDWFTVRKHTVITTAYAVQENDAKFILPTTDAAKELIENLEIRAETIEESNEPGTSALDEDAKEMLDMLPELPADDLNDLTDNAVQNEITDYGD